MLDLLSIPARQALTCLLLSAAGCVFAPHDLYRNTVDDAGTAAPSRHDGAALSESQSEAGSDAVADGSADASLGLFVHDECAAPLPSELPPAPPVMVDASGRPLFDLYRDVSCKDAEAQPLCDGDTPCPASFATSCVRAEDSDAGVCAMGVSDTGRVPFSVGNGRCVAWGVLSVHQRACCANIPGVDCRPWPYQVKSQPGELCARHEDCARGLLCTPYYSYGVCSCPDSDKQPYSC
jgi:hypothetical protein